METTKKRRPVLALLLSLMTPGLGQLYNGQVRRAGFVYLTGILLTAVFFSGFYSKCYFLVLFLVSGICYFLFAMADALYQAIKIRTISLKPYNRWFLYPLIILLHFSFLAFPTYMDLIPLKIYKIPSSSMAPSLLPGDFFIIDKNYYPDKQLERGDIVVFQSPTDPVIDYIKRVVGLPGEQIEIVNNLIYIDSQMIEEPYIGSAGLQKRSINLYSKRNLGPYDIPNDSIYVLGDNRAGSYDSRHYKFVKISAIRGKAMYLLWAEDIKRIGRKLD